MITLGMYVIPIPTFKRRGILYPHCYKVWNAYKFTFTQRGIFTSKHIPCVKSFYPPHKLGVKPLFHHINKVWKPFPPQLQGVKALFPHIYKVWKPYSPHIYTVLKPYSPHLQGVET